MNSRLLIISMMILLMAGGVFIVGTALEQESTPDYNTNVSSNLTSSIPSERNVFARSGNALDYQNMPPSQRSIEDYHENRAYPGAPPSIPHTLISEKGIGNLTCLQCHENGGYVDQFAAYTPVTPHPELINCKQCHLPKKTDLVFKTTNWLKPEPPTIGQAALPGGPPVIPHDLSMRNNCLSCHAGPGALKEIRTSHPERINCRQCHLPKNTEGVFIQSSVRNPVAPGPGLSIGYIGRTLRASEVEGIAAWINHQDN